MKTVVINRRLVLRGVGGATLGLPFLASVQTPKPAYGAGVAFGRQPRFVAFTTEHGGIEGKNMYPDAATLTETTNVLPGHDAKSGVLKRKVDGAEASLSPVLRSSANALTDKIVSKMNVLRGLDIPFYIAHQTGGHLGNYARNDGNGGDGKLAQELPMPTIDQVMAWSPSFYKDLAGTKERSMITGTRGGFSYGWSNPSAKSGTIQEVRREEGSLGLFNKIFVAASSPGVAPRKPIVDRVIENYRTLRNGNRRISALDKQRLDDHMTRLSELQRRLNVSRPASCNAVSKPTDDTGKVGYSNADPVKSKRKFPLYNDVIAAAFMCGTSRIAVVSASDTFSSYSGDWHQEVAHKHIVASQQQILFEALKLTFEATLLDLALKLDVEEFPGATYLDNSLVQWTQECGQETHDASSIPVVTVGGAAGALKTGLFVDYRNLATAGRATPYPNKAKEYAGLTYNRWLATALQSMGVGRAEFERPGVAGYGNPLVTGYYKTSFVKGVLESAGDMLPVIKMS